ncbi:MAG: glycine zipper 2TM domain-containing protein [Comamonadaceae bacterium]|nr:glycine zipper 2TM domain-containing protein [Comamonadaceae bacterium]
MKKLVLFSIVLGTAGLAAAQEQGRVLSVTPIVQQVAYPRQVCSNEIVYSGQRTTGGGAVLGAIAGGAAGNAIGKGNGRAAATAIGLIGGAVLGNQIEGQGRPEYETVQRCGTETTYENRTVGYNVVYEYAGRQYSTQTATDPGRYIAVQVQPVGNAAPYNPGYSSQQPDYYDQSGYAQPGVVTSPYAAPQGNSGVTIIEYGYENDGYRHHRPYPPPRYNPYAR